MLFLELVACRGDNVTMLSDDLAAPLSPVHFRDFRF
jgi:hypothetical protein